MPVQQLMIAQKIAASGGGQPPNTYANLQYWLSARDLATLWETRDNSAPAANDGDFVNRVDTKSPTTRSAATSSGVGDSWTLQLAERNGNNVLKFAAVGGSAYPMSLYVKPASGLNPSSSVVQTSVKAASAGTYVWAGVVDDSVATGVNPYDISAIVNAYSAWGFGFYKSGGNIIFRQYNFRTSDNTYQVAESAPIAPGTPVVISARHNGGAIRVRVNGGTFVSTTSGNTADFGAVVTLGEHANGDLVEFMESCGYNVALSDANLLEVERYFGAALGVTIP